MRSFFVLILLLATISSSYSQKEGLYWFFGRNAGLKFHNGYPESISGSLSTSEGCATISDKNGNLLFYTDGITVYDKSHQIMLNGTGLYGHPSSTQSGVIVPIPGDSNIFYIFTVSNLDKKEDVSGFRYSVVDLQQNNGYGSITEKNTLIFKSTTERITSVKHANNNGIWVIGHEWGSSNFRAYLITSNGINIDNPVVSNVGLVHSDSLLKGKGYMKASPEGDKLAVCIQGKDLIQVFDFNNTTGEISNPIDINGVEQPYGVEFSDKAEFLYASERYSVHIFQWDLNAGSSQAINDSRIIVGELQLPHSLGGALQMAADGKIYIAVKNMTYLAAINNPSQPGLSCDFNEEAVSLGSNRSEWGLPTFIQSFFNNLRIEYKNQCVNDTIFFNLNDPENVDSVKWNFGDPPSGINNTSHIFEPVHVYTETGSYQIELIVYYLDIVDTLMKQITIFAPPNVELGEECKICEGDSVRLVATGNYTSCIWLSNPLLTSNSITVKQEGNYWVDVSTVCGLAHDTVYVAVNPLPEVDLGQDTIIAYNSGITLYARAGYDSYLWQDGSTSIEYYTEKPGTFWVNVSDDFGCKSSDTILIEPLFINIYVPTAFSPNGDNLNDIFAPISAYDVNMKYELMIFNRFGEMVFSSTDFKLGWDGRHHGIPCPVEVYTWILRAEPTTHTLYFAKPVELSGNVTLLR